MRAAAPALITNTQTPAVLRATLDRLRLIGPGGCADDIPLEKLNGLMRRHGSAYRRLHPMHHRRRFPRSTTAYTTTPSIGPSPYASTPGSKDSRSRRIPCRPCVSARCLRDDRQLGPALTRARGADAGWSFSGVCGRMMTGFRFSPLGRQRLVALDRLLQQPTEHQRPTGEQAGPPGRGCIHHPQFPDEPPAVHRYLAESADFVSILGGPSKGSDWEDRKDPSAGRTSPSEGKEHQTPPSSG